MSPKNHCWRKHGVDMMRCFCRGCPRSTAHVAAEQAQVLERQSAALLQADENGHGAEPAGRRA
jgi:hypothetical protein